MEKKHIRMVLFALVLMLLLPGMAAEAKTKPTLAERNKTTAAGQGRQKSRQRTILD